MDFKEESKCVYMRSHRATFLRPSISNNVESLQIGSTVKNAYRKWIYCCCLHLTFHGIDVGPLVPIEKWLAKFYVNQSTKLRLNVQNWVKHLTEIIYMLKVSCSFKEFSLSWLNWMKKAHTHTNTFVFSAKMFVNFFYKK